MGRGWGGDPRPGNPAPILALHKTLLRRSHVEPTLPPPPARRRAVQLRKLCPSAGDVVYSSARRGLLLLEADTSPGGHDTLCAACCPARYALLGLPADPPHDSCAANLRAALAGLGLEYRVGGGTGPGLAAAAMMTPCPLNLWMRMDVAGDVAGSMTWRPPSSAAGDWVVLRALLDCVVVLSACPMDVSGLPVNGGDGVRDCHFEVVG